MGVSESTDLRTQAIERTLRFADKVTRELLPLTPRDTILADVTAAQLKVMFVLFLRGTVRSGVLAKALGVSLPTMTVTVDRLVRKGVVIRVNDPLDRRAVCCKLSEHGEQMLNQMWEKARQRTRQMLSALSIDELKVVENALEILLKAGQVTRALEPESQVPHDTSTQEEEVVR